MKITVIDAPYNDEDMVYNTTTGLYTLTKKYVKENFEVTYQNDAELERRLSKVSRSIRAYISWKTPSFNKAVVDFMLHRTQEGRKFLKDVLLSAMESDLESGYYSFSTQAPLGIDRQVQRDNRVDVKTEDIIDSCESYFGFYLFIQIQFNYLMYKFVAENMR